MGEATCIVCTITCMMSGMRTGASNGRGYVYCLYYYLHDVWHKDRSQYWERLRVLSVLLPA